MDARFYNSEDIDIERLANDLLNVYLSQGYQAQQIGANDQVLVQLKKGGDFEAVIGMQAALSVTIQRTAGGVLALIGQQKWLDKAAVGAVGIVALPVLWPLALTAGVGAWRQASLGNQVLNIIDGLVRQQRPGIQAGPIPMQLMPQVQRQWAPSPYAPTPAYVPSSQPPFSQEGPRSLPSPVPIPALASGRMRCNNCNTPYDAGDTFCSGCGRSLAPARLLCSNCKFEVKPGVSFCPKCGTSTFQSQSGTQAANPAPPVYTPPAPVPQPAPVYTPPPKSPTPTYTPPTSQSIPVYTPPPKPPTPVYMPPTVESTIQPAPTAPTEPYYVPPVTQTPEIVPQPKVTITQSVPKQESPVAPTQPVRPPTPYYTPPAQSQPADPRLQKPAQQPAPPKPIVARPTSQPALASDAPWGNLIWSDGTETQLSGERAVVGRYDHDLGGIYPEIDLGKAQAADTVSRVHAVLEHIGSTYTLTDLNSTNSTRINGKRLEPDKAMPITDGDTLHFGKVTCTFKKF